MSYAKEIIGGSWHGVVIPGWLRCFDCRKDDAEAFPKAPWGETLFGSECASTDLGLKRGYSDNDGTTPVSCSTYIDARKADSKELARQINDAILEATALRDKWLAAQADPAPEGMGGGCEYQPIAICLSNFGWSVLSDRRTCAIKKYYRY